LSAPGKTVVVRAAVAFTFLDEPLVDERVQIRVEPTVVDFLLVVLFEFVLDGEAVWFFLAGIVYRRSRWKPVRSYISLHYGSISTEIILSRETERW